jgi:hypothetical protein
MTEINDRSFTPIELPRASSDAGAGTKATAASPRFTPEDDRDIGRCIQDVDPSYASTVSHIGDCNLECCYCAVRWHARRVLHLKEN